MNEAELAWYKSKKLVALIVNHTIVLVVSIFGIIKDPNASGQIVTSALAEVGPVTAAHLIGQSTVDVKQATSPYYAAPGQAYPPTPLIPPGVKTVTITSPADVAAMSATATPTTPQVPIVPPSPEGKPHV